MTLLKVVSFGVLGLFASLIIVFSLLVPYRDQKILRRKWFWNDLLLYGLLQSVVMGLLIGYLIHYLDTQTEWSRLRVVSDWPIWVQLSFFVVTHDLFIYVFHRLMHKYDFLWRFHEAHHSIDDVDFVSGLRSHPFEIGVNQTVEYGAMILLGAAPEVAVIKGVVSLAWGVWIHHNIDIKTGWLQYVINGAEMHRWHHHPEHMYKNYATKFAFWDWIFGTAYFPRDQKVDRYGLDNPEYPGGWWRQFLAFFRKLPEHSGAVPSVHGATDSPVTAGDGGDSGG